MMKAVILFVVLMLSIQCGEAKAVGDMKQTIQDLMKLLKLEEQALQESDIAKKSAAFDLTLQLKSESKAGPVLSHQAVDSPVMNKRNSYGTPDKYKCYLGSSSPQERSIKDEALHAHNELRHRHNAQALVWNDALQQEAQAQANYIAANNDFAHSSTTNGENIAYTSVGVGLGVDCMTPAKHIARWYNEIDAYFGDGSGVTGHFTQVVWSSTTDLGCGVSTASDGTYDTTYLVCQYSPAGNFVSQYEANVNPPVDGVHLIDNPNELEMLSGVCDYSGSCSPYASYCTTPGFEFILDYCLNTCNN